MRQQARTLWPFFLAVLVAGGCGVKQHPHPPEPVEPEPDPVNETGGSPGNSDRGGSQGTGSGGSGGSASTRSGGTGGGASNAGGNLGANGGNPGAGGNGQGGAGNPPRSDAAEPPSTPGPTIGGMQVAKEKAIVFLHIGHSDMAGRADGPAELRGFVTNTDPHLWTYAKGGTFRMAKEPTAGDAQSAGKAGPGMAILRTALGKVPDAYFISIGHGHSGAANGYCPNFRKAGLFWGLYMDAAKELKGKVTFGGLFTMFGITEYHLGTPGLSKLAECIAGIASEVRAELDAPDMPLLVGDWNMGGTGIYSPTSDYAKIARPQLQMVPTLDPRAAVISTDGLKMQDDRHLNFEGQKVWAERGFELMTEKNWIPWAK